MCLFVYCDTKILKISFHPNLYQKKIQIIFEEKNIMEEIMETIYAKEGNTQGCKTCKNKTNMWKEWSTWVGLWMFGMAIYGNYIFFRNIFDLIF